MSKRSTIIVGPTDLEALALIGTLGWPTTEQIVRDLAWSLDYGRRRLCKLRSHRLCGAALTGSGRDPRIYKLTKTGKALLRRQAPHLAAQLRNHRPVELGGLLHHAGVIDSRLYASEYGALVDAPLTRWSGPGGESHREFGLERFRLRPDAIAQFQAHALMSVAIEVDTGTEGHRALITKLEKHRRAAERERLDALWFIVLAGPRRCRGVAELIESAGLGDFSRVMDRRHVVVRPVRPLPHRRSWLGAAPIGASIG